VVLLCFACVVEFVFAFARHDFSACRCVDVGCVAWLLLLCFMSVDVVRCLFFLLFVFNVG